MSSDMVARQIQLATLFVRRVLGLPSGTRSAIQVPGYQDEYYVEATLYVRTLIQTAGHDSGSGAPGPTTRMQEFVRRAERALEDAGLPGELGAVTAEAVRAILVWPLANAQPWASSVYQPFEALIPYEEQRT
jgi:hypothetical protein